MAGISLDGGPGVTLRISYFVPPAPLVAARGSAPLMDIDLVEVATSGSPAQLDGLLSGALDVVVTAIDNLFAWVEAGADAALVGQVEATTPMGIYGGRAFGTLTDLAGARFAVDASTNGFALIGRYLLHRASTEVEYVEVGGVAKRLDALVDGSADATLLGPPFDAMAREAGMHEIANVQSEFPAFPGQGLVVRRPLLGTPEVDAFLEAMREGGLLGVDPVGLDLLTRIRGELGLLPEGVDLHALSVKA